MRPRLQNRGRRGFTLLELLVVVLILSAIAFVALDSLQADTNQFRFEDTRTRLSLMREAIVGPRDTSANAQPIVAGFVADVGRLPRCLQELVVREVDCDDDDTVDTLSPRAWSLDAVSGTGLYSGWRGPYVSVMREASGLVAFRDGWSNAIDLAPENYGWSRFTDTAGDLVVQSLGRDGAANPTDAADYNALALYEQDFPPTADPTVPTTAPDPLIETEEHRVPLGTVTVTLRNDTAGDITVPLDALCLRVFFPDPDPANPAIQSADSGSGPTAATTIPAGTQISVPLVFATPADVAWGRRAVQLLDFDSGTSTCGGGADPSYNDFPIRVTTLLPQAAFPEVVWAAE